MNSVQLDQSKMLGFKILTINQSEGKLGSKVGTKPVAPKIGSKMGSKLGAKVGMKPS